MIRKFEIHNTKYNENLGTLHYDTETEEFRIEMLDDYTGLHPDIMMTILGKERGEKWITGRNMANYMRQRIFPPNRHMVNDILAKVGLSKYKVIDILDITHGRCDMDDNIFIEIIEWGKT